MMKVVALMFLWMIFQLCNLTLCHSSISNDRIDKFYQWFLDNGGYVRESLGIFHTMGMGKGVVTNSHLSAKDLLFSIPENLIISPSNILTGNRTSNKEKKIYERLPSSDLIMVAFLVKERALGRRSFWSPYLELLPSASSFPVFWTRFELSLLEDIALESSLSSDKLFMKRDHAIVKPMLKLLLEILDPFMSPDKLDSLLDFEMFAWANSMLRSRALTIEGHQMLLPFACFLNHGAHPMKRDHNNGAFFKEHHTFYSNNGSFSIFSDRDVAANHQVLEDYGDNQNSIYLQYHGFVPNEINQFNCITLTLHPINFNSNDSSKLNNIRLHILSSLRLSTSMPRLCISANPYSWENELIAWESIAIHSMNETELQQCLGTLKGSICDHLSNFISNSTKYEIIYNAANVRLNEYTTSIEQDEELIAQIILSESTESFSDNAKTAIMYRKWQKILLVEVLDMLQVLKGHQNSSNDEDNESSTDSLDRIAAVTDVFEKKNSSVVTINTSDVIFGKAAKNFALSDKNSITIFAMTFEKEEQIDIITNDDYQDGTLQERIDRFNGWVSSSLGYGTNMLTVSAVDGYRIGAIAKADIDVEQEYLSMPLSSTMSSETAYKHPKIGPILETLLKIDDPAGLWDDSSDPLRLQLAYEMFVERDKSWFWPYLSLLPSLSEMNIPLTFSDVEVDLLKESDIHRSVMRYRGLLNSAYTNKWSDKGIFSLPETSFLTLDRYIWTSAIMDTRCIWWNGKRNLVPLLDFINHGQKSGELSRVHSTKVDDSGKFASTSAAWSFLAGEQVFEDYGQPNHVYFLYHGFIAPDNKRDCIKVDLQPPIDTSREKLKNIRRMFSRDPELCVSATRVQMEFVGWIRIMYDLPYPPSGGISWESVLDIPGLNALIDWTSNRLSRAASYKNREWPKTQNSGLIWDFLESELNILEKMIRKFSEMLYSIKSIESVS